MEMKIFENTFPHEDLQIRGMVLVFTFSIDQHQQLQKLELSDARS
jgi:hypothetical protein